MRDRRLLAVALIAFSVAASVLLARLSVRPAWISWLPLLIFPVVTLAGCFQNSGLLAPVFLGVKTGETIVSLTLDDGPHPDFTPRVLEILDRYGAKACFFCLGWRVERHPDLVREILARGHEVGNHSDRHLFWMSLLGPLGTRREIAAAQEKFRRAAGRAPVYYRQPLGLLNPFLGWVLWKENLTLVGFSLLARDNRPFTPAEIAAEVGAALRPGRILAMHDGLANRPHDRERSVEALPLILEEIRARGYHVVPLSELLARCLPRSGPPHVEGDR